MTQNSNGVIFLITLLNILVYKLQQLQEAKFKHQQLQEAKFTEQTNQLSLNLQRLCRRFSLRDIQWATFNFHDELVIGQGGFGKVYRGIIDFGAGTVAIKRLKSTSKQGSKEFLTEIEMLSKFQHSHVVSLVGYCDDCHEMILVYEYMPCGTLADHLHKRVRKGDTSSPPLSWEQRLKICIGAARGLEYLHTGTSVQHRVIHRDVKSSNILLDENMAAKISDFGLSKIGPSNQAFSTYVSTRVKGTPGYMDPYYFATLRLTRKSDVYGFGVVLFEVLCGRPAVDNRVDEEQRGLALWAQQCFKEGLLDQIIDPSIKGKIFPDSLAAFVRVAIQCLHNGPKHRPTMAEVVVGLESALALQEGSTIYILPEVPLTNCSSQVNVNSNSSALEGQIMKYNQEQTDSSMVWGNHGNLGSPMVEVENANHNQENKNSSLEKGVSNDADGGHHDEQSPARMTFTEKLGLFLSGRARMFSGHNDAKPSRNRRSNNNRIMAPNLRMFTLAELRKATRGFRPDMVLGEGGFGKVYKGWVHEKTYAPSKFGVGMAIAVKRFASLSQQGFEELRTEIKFLGNYSHPNLVKLLGYCQEDKELLLVYEHMEKGSLDFHLFKSAEQLPWSVRLKVLIGAARCLAFFHTAETQVILHSFNTADILLDGGFNAKLSNLVMAKIDPRIYNAYMSTRLMGTLGYIAPEYIATGHVSGKTEVYSFGVVFLELLTGRKVIDLIRDSMESCLTDQTWDNEESYLAERTQDSGESYLADQARESEKSYVVHDLIRDGEESYLADQARDSENSYVVDWAKPLLVDKSKVRGILDPSLANDFPNDAMLSVVASLILECLNTYPKNRPSMVQVLQTLETLVPSP